MKWKDSYSSGILSEISKAAILYVGMNGPSESERGEVKGDVKNL